MAGDWPSGSSGVSGDSSILSGSTTGSSGGSTTTRTRLLWGFGGVFLVLAIFMAILIILGVVKCETQTKPSTTSKFKEVVAKLINPKKPTNPWATGATGTGTGTGFTRATGATGATGVVPFLAPATPLEQVGAGHAAATPEGLPLANVGPLPSTQQRPRETYGGGALGGPGTPIPDAYTAIFGGPGAGLGTTGRAPALFPANDMAYRTGVAQAQAVESASRLYASTLADPVQGGGQQASAADIQAVADNTAAVNGAEPLGAVFVDGKGVKLEYQQPTTIQPVAGVDEPWNNTDKLLAFLDPEGAAQLDKALSLSATPSRFFDSREQEDAIQAEQRAKYWRRNGKLDLSAEEILDDRPVWVPTAAAIRQSVLGNGVDRTIATSFPRRFAYPDMPGGRMVTPRVQFTSESVLQEPMLPGYDVHLSSQTCNTCKIQTMEPL